MGLKNFFGQLLLSFAVEVLAMDVLLLGREEKMKPCAVMTVVHTLDE